MRIEGLILAAGLSSRAPGFKMTLPFGEVTVLESAINGMLSVCDRIVVVGGYQHERLKAICNKYEAVELVINRAYEEGMFSSIKCGLKHLSGDRFFMMPGDYPLVSELVYETLLKHEGDVIIPSFDYHAGHPILMNASSLKTCLEEGRFKSMREFIKTLEVHYVMVKDQGVLMDIDTAEDYDDIKRRLESANK